MNCNSSPANIQISDNSTYGPLFSVLVELAMIFLEPIAKAWNIQIKSL
jgi:hypothetical protein